MRLSYNQKNRAKPLLCCVVISVATALLTSNAAALFIDRGNGMVYDTEQDLTWLSDSSFVITQYLQSGGTAGDADGRMTWGDAMNWAENLEFGGFSDWRLPTTLQPDPSCDQQINVGPSFPTQGFDTNCTGSELGNLFYNGLGGLAGESILDSIDVDTDLFSLVATGFWTATDFEPFGPNSHVWHFDFGSGKQGTTGKNLDNHFAWAVRSGDVGDGIGVPEANSLVLLLGGVFLLLLFRKIRGLS